MTAVEEKPVASKVDVRIIGSKKKPTDDISLTDVVGIEIFKISFI